MILPREFLVETCLFVLVSAGVHRFICFSMTHVPKAKANSDTTGFSSNRTKINFESKFCETNTQMFLKKSRLFEQTLQYVAMHLKSNPFFFFFLFKSFQHKTAARLHTYITKYSADQFLTGKFGNF